MSAVLFLVPAWWPVLLALPLGLAGLLAVSRRWHRRVDAELGVRAAAIVGVPVHRRTRAWLAAGAAAGTALALLQPVAGAGEGDPVGPDVVLCLDVSRSMDARDLLPSRLAAAQREIERLADTAGGARVGLVVFAGDVHLAAPLTADLRAVAAIAQSFAAGAVGRGGSDPGAAIDAAAAALDRATARAGGIVLLGDGEDFVGNGVAAAARAREAGRVVHCIGYGAPAGSKIPTAGDGDGVASYLRDARGEFVITRLERANLAAIANEGGGALHEPLPGALATLVADDLARAAVAVAVHDDTRNPAHRFQWPLFAALLLWMLRSALPERRRLPARQR